MLIKYKSTSRVGPRKTQPDTERSGNVFHIIPKWPDLVFYSDLSSPSPGTEMVHTTDGWTWTPSAGVRKGLPTIGAVEPLTHFESSKAEDIHDVIVIGAGYAGLVASRDLSTQGRSQLSLLAARILTALCHR